MQPFSYVKPRSLDEAVTALQSGDNVQAIAGGTTVVDLMRLDVMTPRHVVLLDGIDELRGIDTGGDTLRFGALATMSEVAGDPVVQNDYPVLYQSLWKAASPQLRNMASVGGNLLQQTRCPYYRDTSFACNRREPGSGCDAIQGNNYIHAVLGTSDQCIATYPGDWAVALVALDASIEIAGNSGVRQMKVKDLHRPPDSEPWNETVLEEHELITAITVPASELGKHSVYTKVRERESYAFATASAAVALIMDGDTVQEARIAVGGVATVPWRAETAEASLIGKTLDETAATEAGKLVFADATAYSHNAYKIPLGIDTVAEALLTVARGGA